MNMKMIYTVIDVDCGGGGLFDVAVYHLYVL